MGTLCMVNDKEVVFNNDTTKILKAFADLESSTNRGAINKVIITSTPSGSAPFMKDFESYMALSTAIRHLSEVAKTSYSSAKRRPLKKG